MQNEREREGEGELLVMVTVNFDFIISSRIRNIFIISGLFFHVDFR